MSTPNRTEADASIAATFEAAADAWPARMRTLPWRDAAELATKIRDEAVEGAYDAGHADGYHEGRTDRLAPSIDADHLAHQREWSTETFGPGRRTKGVLKHLRKELVEVEADPTDVGEWVDVIILAFDGALRHGAEPQEIIDAIKAKQARNEARSWPDWRTRSEDEAIEHDRSADPPGDRVVDLMAALEDSVARAKAARLRHPQPRGDAS